eukprot:s446_g9.t1
MDIKHVDKHIFFDLVMLGLQSISTAFSTALQCFENWSPAQVEEELRKTALFTAKLEDETSIFRLLYHPDIGSIREHWKWYTHCLLHPSSYFTNGTEFRNPPDPCVVRLPLDFVDLQMLSNKYKVRINIFRYSDEIRFTPCGADDDDLPRVHLVYHQGLWADSLAASVRV